MQGHLRPLLQIVWNMATTYRNFPHYIVCCCCVGCLLRCFFFHHDSTHTKKNTHTSAYHTHQKKYTYILEYTANHMTHTKKKIKQHPSWVHTEAYDTHTKKNISIHHEYTIRHTKNKNINNIHHQYTANHMTHTKQKYQQHPSWIHTEAYNTQNKYISYTAILNTHRIIWHTKNIFYNTLHNIMKHLPSV